MNARNDGAPRRPDDRGASAVEYGLMIAAVAAIVVGVVFGIGQLVDDAFTSTADQLSACTETGEC